MVHATAATNWRDPEYDQIGWGGWLAPYPIAGLADDEIDNLDSVSISNNVREHPAQTPALATILQPPLSHLSPLHFGSEWV